MKKALSLLLIATSFAGAVNAQLFYAQGWLPAVLFVSRKYRDLFALSKKHISIIVRTNYIIKFVVSTIKRWRMF